MRGRVRLRLPCPCTCTHTHVFTRSVYGCYVSSASNAITTPLRGLACKFAERGAAPVVQALLAGPFIGKRLFRLTIPRDIFATVHVVTPSLRLFCFLFVACIVSLHWLVFAEGRSDTF